MRQYVALEYPDAELSVLMGCEFEPSGYHLEQMRFRRSRQTEGQTIPIPKSERYTTGSTPASWFLDAGQACQQA